MRAGLAAALALLAAAPASGQDADFMPGPDLQAVGEPAFLLSLGWLAQTREDTGAAVILGSVGEGHSPDGSLTTFDRIFLPPIVEGRRMVPGDVVQLYRLERIVADPTTYERLGVLAVPSGVATVDSLAGEVIRATITDAFGPVLLGDRARPVAEADTIWVAPASVSPIGAEGVVVDFQTQKAIVPPYDRVFVRRREGPALMPGDRVWFYRPGPIRQGLQLPDLEIGRGVVVRTQGDVAVTILLDVRRADLTPGDRFREEAPPGP